MKIECIGNLFFNEVLVDNDSIAQICTGIPYLWWAVPFIIIFKKMGIGGYLYDYIASKRKVIPVGNCDDLCELQSKRVH